MVRYMQTTVYTLSVVYGKAANLFSEASVELILKKRIVYMCHTCTIVVPGFPHVY